MKLLLERLSSAPVSPRFCGTITTIRARDDGCALRYCRKMQAVDKFACGLASSGSPKMLAHPVRSVTTAAAAAVSVNGHRVTYFTVRSVSTISASPSFPERATSSPLRRGGRDGSRADEVGTGAHLLSEDASSSSIEPPPPTFSSSSTDHAAVSSSNACSDGALRVAAPSIAVHSEINDHRRSAASRGRPRPTAASVGKSKHVPGKDKLKVKAKAPWGAQQLRDSWSEDAMTKRDRDNMNERLHREYRYHPEEFRRHYILYAAVLSVPCILTSLACCYYYITGRPFWKADPQYLLNMIRVADTSPRSHLYAYRMPEMETLPRHVREYRAQHAGERTYNERVFRVTHSAFQRPDENALRLLELEEQAREEAETEAVEEEES